MPLSTYREYFPELVSLMLLARSRQRVAHAYLLVGDTADQLVDIAEAWIQVCACQKPTSSGDACGECEPCRLLGHHNYPELFTLRPRSKSRRIRVDDVRDLEHQLGLKATPGRLKAGL